MDNKQECIRDSLSKYKVMSQITILMTLAEIIFKTYLTEALEAIENSEDECNEARESLFETQNEGENMNEIMQIIEKNTKMVRVCISLMNIFFGQKGRDACADKMIEWFT